VLSTGGSSALVGVSFCENSAAQGGGARITSGTATVRGSSFVENSATNLGGGLQVSMADGLLVSLATFLGNGADTLGGNLYVGDVTAEISDSLVAWVTAGDGLYVKNGTDHVLSHDAWYENVDEDISGVLTVDDLDSTHLLENPGASTCVLGDGCAARF